LKSAGFVGGIGFILYEIFGNHSIKTLFIFMTSYGFSATFNVIFIYSPEIFPTSIGSTFMGFLYLISRLGALIVPTVTITIPHTPILFGILSIVSSYLCFQLTETLGKDIDDDMPEVNRLSYLLQMLLLINQGKSAENILIKCLLQSRFVSDFYFKIED
jgi:hypothetical protein